MKMPNVPIWPARIALGILFAFSLNIFAHGMQPGLFIRTGGTAEQATASQSGLNELASSLFDHTTHPSLVMVSTYQSSILNECTGESRKVLNAWLRFLMIYGRFELKSVARNDATIRETLFANAAQLDSIAPSQISLLKPLVAHLLEYHEKIVSVDDWDTKLNQIVRSTDGATTLEKIYAAGYPKSEDACFITPLALEASSPPQHFSRNEAALERWFYTFWTRRFSEETMAATYYGLKLIESSLGGREDSMDRVFVFETPEINRIDQYSNSPSPLDAYQNLLVSRLENSGRAIWVNGTMEKPSHQTIYAFAGAARGQAAGYLRTEEGYSGDEARPSFTHIYEATGEDASPIGFYSIEPVTDSLNQYFPAELNDTESVEIAALMKKDFGSAWGIEATRQGRRDCTDRPGTIRSFRNAAERIYVIEKDCGKWTGEGSYGPYIVAVAVRDPARGLYIRHRYLGLSGLAFVYGDYVADLDGDGNMEVLLQTSEGLSSSLHLVELTRNGWTELRGLGHYSEGGYADYTERSKNERLLYSQ